MRYKTKAPQIADNNLKGYLSRAISHTSLDNSIVRELPEKGKAHNGLLQLQFAL
jgi:hypothetical protein